MLILVNWEISQFTSIDYTISKFTLKIKQHIFLIYYENLQYPAPSYDKPLNAENAENTHVFSISKLIL